MVRLRPIQKQALPGSNGRTLIVSANSSWALTNYRMNLLQALSDEGYSIVALVPSDEGVQTLKAAGIDICSIPIRAHGTSPLEELILLARYFGLLRRLRPTAFLGFTIKPNIYGALAGAVCGVPVINNVTGLGLVFSGKRPLRWIVDPLYRLAFLHSRRVFFQNRESFQLFKTLGFVRDEQAGLLPGSGIDLDRFTPIADHRKAEGPFTFLLASRLLWQKGIAEYCAAARLLRASRRDVKLQLLGSIEVSSRDAVPVRQLEEWQQEGVIDYLGATEDVRSYLASADCVVLPSYYPEGVPRVLIEAAAMGKPVITTDTPGCRDALLPGETGLLCEPRSTDSLANTMMQLLDRPPRERQKMGRLARKMAEDKFDEKLVIRAYLSALETIEGR
jgi:glycosyltransferase involved in cell wall biosynthesis